MLSDSYYVYIVKCSDKSLYTGIALDLEKRILQHNGMIPGGSKYTRSRNPVSLVYSEKLHSRSKASIREAEIKKMTRKEKEEVIERSHSCSA